ncbi:hypothetical protein WSM22_30340 [Cytophagales bacterium WSM2-2]|nr:hypothetical protein WSM22_30340 [Cytophagales bacterium WSM2-2]
MKKIFILSLLVCIGFTTSFAQMKKVALISVFGSRNLSDDPMEGKIYEVLMKDSSFNLVKIVNNFDVLIRDKFVPQFPFPFFPKEEVVNAAGYQDLRALTRWAKDNYYTTSATSYVPIAAFGIVNDNDAIKKAFEVVPGADGVMIAYIDFNIFTSGGFGPLAKKKIAAYCNLKIFNKDAKRIFKLRERAVSNDGTMSVAGYLTDVKEIMPMIEQAATNLFADMQEKLPKSLAKMAKQMDKYNKD